MATGGPQLGKLIEDGDRRRDAVHIAVAPMTALTEMRPGEPAGLCYEGDYEHAKPGALNAVGIVDPFLERPVKRGERFWLFLYPNTITGLRHVWTHPAFAPRVPTDGK